MGVPRRAEKWLSAVVAGQAAFVAAGAAVAAAAVFPATFGKDWRARRMAAIAHDQVVASWLGQELTPSDVVLTGESSHALFPRPFASEDAFQGWRPLEIERAALHELLQSRRVTVMTVTPGEELPPPLAELARDAVPIGPPLEFEQREHHFWPTPVSIRRLQLLRLRRPGPGP
jgi:hypothetical protein